MSISQLSNKQKMKRRKIFKTNEEARILGYISEKKKNEITERKQSDVICDQLTVNRRF